MNLPILGRLRDGVKFDLETLLDNYDDVEAYWKEWWDGRDLSIIDRPETISDNDPILTPTAEKDTVDLTSNAEFFNEQLTIALDKKRLTRCKCGSRANFRKELTNLIGSNSTVLKEPRIIFAGGGYGSGKTTTIGHLAGCGMLPLGREHMVGVDYFKLYIPEFNLIQEMADGRASFTAQKECKDLAANLFEKLIESGRSFIWDSSMSDEAETMAKIALAAQKGYKLSLIAILTEVEIAIRQAMDRANSTKRFPHKDFLPKSHIDFRKLLMKCVAVFQEVMVLENLRKVSDSLPTMIAEKKDGKELAILDTELFHQLTKIS